MKRKIIIYLIVFLIFIVERMLAIKFKKTGYDLSLQSSKKDRGQLQK